MKKLAEFIIYDMQEREKRTKRKRKKDVGEYAKKKVTFETLFSLLKARLQTGCPAVMLMRTLNKSLLSQSPKTVSKIANCLIEINIIGQFDFESNAKKTSGFEHRK